MSKLIQHTILIATLLTCLSLTAQVAWLTPADPSPTDTVTLTYDTNEGNKGLEGWEGTVYLHTGAITEKSIDGGDWKHVTGNWGKDDEQVKMTAIGDGLHQFTFVIKDYYQLRDEEIVQQLAFVFRNLDGSKVGKTAKNEDIFLPVNGYTPPVKEPPIYLFSEREYISHELFISKLMVRTNHGQVQITPYTPRIIEVKNYTDAAEVANDPSEAVILKPVVIFTELKQSREWLRYSTDSLTVLIHKNPFYIAYEYKGDTILQEDKGFFKRTDNDGLQFRIKDDEKLYGLGERAIDFNLTGQKYNLYNRPKYGYELPARNLNYCVPLVVSSKKYMLFFDNPQKGYADLGETNKGILEWGAIGGVMKYFVIAGYSHYNVQQQWTDLTGKQPLPPRWVLGNLQSRMAYRTQYETDSIVSLMQEKDFPIDAIIIDFYWFGDSIQGTMGRLKWYKPNWPEPEKMISDFKDKGVKTVLITEPYILDSLDNFKIADSLGILALDSTGNSYVNYGFYFGYGALIDIFKPEAQQWFWDQYQKQIEKGVAGWWGDLGEPENHPSDQIHINGMADEVHNIFGHYWHKMIFENYRKHYPAKRLFNLNRAGFAGSQRYSVYPWTGDVARSWGGFQAQLPTMLHMSMSGLPFIHSDAGGFAQGSKDEELYTRWVQFSCFTPILRPHGSVIPSEPVYFNEQTQDIVRKFMKLRYSLIPYIYSTAAVAHVRGYPITRPMFFDFPDDSTTYNLANQYMFGPSMLVAPVIEKGQEKIDVYLPEGRWYDFWTDEEYTGKGWRTFKTELETIPILIKEGSFIPSVPPVNSTDYYSSKELTVKYYNGSVGDTSFSSMFEDDGKTFGTVGRGEFELLRFYSYHPDNRTSEIFLIKDGWDYNGMPKQRLIKLVFANSNAEKKYKVSFNGKKVKTKKNDDEPQQYFNENGKLVLEFKWDPQVIDIIVKEK